AGRQHPAHALVAVRTSRSSVSYYSYAFTPLPARQYHALAAKTVARHPLVSRPGLVPCPGAPVCSALPRPISMEKQGECLGFDGADRGCKDTKPKGFPT